MPRHSASSRGYSHTLIESEYKNRISKVIRKMQLNIEEKQRIAEEMRTLRSKTEELKKECSDLRKEGYYTKIVDSILMDIWPKIRMYGATGSEDDHKIVLDMLDETRSEIEKIKTNEDNVYWKKDP